MKDFPPSRAIQTGISSEILLFKKVIVMLVSQFLQGSLRQLCIYTPPKSNLGASPLHLTEFEPSAHSLPVCHNHQSFLENELEMKMEGNLLPPLSVPDYCAISSENHTQQRQQQLCNTELLVAQVVASRPEHHVCISAAPN